ncbi:hypothetical protein I4U23_026774 [Adineta vaga]|nr:hypothetical protein I4U23_026774 [Adineta vaga]
MLTMRMCLILFMGYYLTIDKIDAGNVDLTQFSAMINYKGYSSWDYYGYGCWCGSGTHGTEVVDRTDNCCRVHDLCYDEVQSQGCSPKWGVSYSWSRLSNREIRCTDGYGTCDRKTCDCDKAAVDCFAATRRTYNSFYRQLSNSQKQYLCNW